MKEKISFFLSFPVNIKELSGESFALVIIYIYIYIEFYLYKKKSKKMGKKFVNLFYTF